MTTPAGNRIVPKPVEGIYPAPAGEYSERPAYDFPVPIGGSGEYSSKAYTRIEVEGEGATATSTETFDIEND